MTTASFRQRYASQSAGDAGEHLLSVGQSVRLKSAIGNTTGQTQVYRITGMMPASAGAPQYRIRNAEENHERVALQDELELVDTTGLNAKATLMERTFGHG
ncbi:hypothetical protein [Stappia sp. MMSF_3263]|uniref:hypothetical protein n=1 Tax=Stappia sp. MMSF_3263 TaxID=3046693 RepID=UPI00273FB2F5|nr:hypothetical protein [Stappia sp. MMSF_3263]